MITPHVLHMAHCIIQFLHFFCFTLTVTRKQYVFLSSRTVDSRHFAIAVSVADPVYIEVYIIGYSRKVEVAQQQQA